MSSFTVYVNSSLFDRLLLPGRPGQTLYSQIIVDLKHVMRGSSTHSLNEEQFVSLCSNQTGLGRTIATSLFILAQQYFSGKSKQEAGPVSWRGLLLTLSLQLFQLDAKRLVRSNSVDRISTEQWPGSSSTITRKRKTYEEDAHVEFYKRRLHLLWDILYTPDDPGFWDHVFKVQHNFQDSTFADFLTHHVDETDLPRLIISNLKTTCDGVLACIKSGKRLTWTLGDIVPPQKKEGKPKMATTAHQKKQLHVIAVNQIFNKTIARRSSTLAESKVKIHRVHNSFIYLLNTLHSLNISKCSNATIVTGPVRTTIRVSGCKNIKLVSMGRAVLVGETWDSSFFVSTEERLMVDGETCGNLVLQPYSANYKGLDDDLFGLSFHFNEFPLVLNSELNDGLDKSYHRIVRTNADEFVPQLIPFKGFNINNINNLPDKFSNQVRKRKETMEHWKAYLGAQAQDLDACSVRLVERSVNQLFEAWLSRSHDSELRGLVSMLTKQNLNTD